MSPLPPPPTPHAPAPASRPYPLPPLMLLAAATGAVLVPWRCALPFANPDSHAFVALAGQLQSGHGLSYQEPMLPGLLLRAFRSPAYPTLLAGALGLGGVTLALALQGAMAGLTAALGGAIAARIAGARAGLIAFAAMMLWVFAWRMAGELMTETLYALCVVLVTLLALRAAPIAAGSDATRATTQAPPGPGWVLALGGVLALGLLTRPSGFALMAAIGLSVPLARPRVRVALLSALALALLLWAPWPLRNQRVLGAPVISLTSGGINAWNGNVGRPIGDGWTLMAANRPRGELGLDRMFWRLTADEVLAHPRDVAARLARKALDYAAPPPLGAAQGVHTLLWPLALLALVLAARGQLPWGGVLAWPALVWAAHALLTTLTVVNDRYRFPTDALVIVVGAIGVESLLRRFGARRGGGIALAVGVGGALLSSGLRALL